MVKNYQSHNKDIHEQQSSSRDFKKKVRHSDIYEKEILENKISDKSLGFSKSEEKDILEILACFDILQEKELREKELIESKSNSKESNIKKYPHNKSPDSQSKAKVCKINSKTPRSSQIGEQISPSSTRGLNHRSRIYDDHENELLDVHQSSSLEMESAVANLNDSEDTLIPNYDDSTNTSQEDICIKKNAKQEILSHRSSSRENDRESRNEERSRQQTRRRPEHEETNYEHNKRAKYLHRSADMENGRIRSDPIPIWEKYGIRLEICSTKFFTKEGRFPVFILILTVTTKYCANLSPFIRNSPSLRSKTR